MKVTYLGHACFKYTMNDSSIILDPYKAGSVDGLKPLQESANLVLCSHQHGDHNAKDEIAVNGTNKDFEISTLASYHDDVQGSKRGPNTIHILKCEDGVMAHLGDQGCDLTPDQIQALKHVDVLCIPVGGFFTIDAKKAKEIIDLVEPRIVIPMHYRTEKVGFEVLGTIQDFTGLMNNVEMMPQSSLDITNEMKGVKVLTPLYQD